MGLDDLPKPVRQLIVRHIDSIQQVEALELLSRDPDREWTSAQVSRTLHIPAQACATWLDQFVAAGLVDRGGDGVKHATKGRDARAVDDLIDLYGRRRTTVIEAIYNKPSSAIQSFSDAFRVRRQD